MEEKILKVLYEVSNKFKFSSFSCNTREEAEMMIKDGFMENGIPETMYQPSMSINVLPEFSLQGE